MQEIVIACTEDLIKLRNRYWELDKSEPIWIWLGLRWCINWLSDYGEEDVND